MIVLDTNVLSELMRPTPAAEVVAWVGGVPGPEIRTTAISVAEIRYGLARLPGGARRRALEAVADEVFDLFRAEVLPFDEPAAVGYARIVSARDSAGLPISGFDAQIAAICAARGGVLATRNTRDFTGTGIDLVDPWAG